MKGGGSGGGPNRWSGSGPRPARHIPWPEIFKHHISVIEGHLKMVDMVKKHTIPETGNWRTIVPIVERTQEMLQAAKDVTRNFVPPPNEIEKVPIGSSSESMYPGYSPADHRYSEAAHEFGIAWSAAKARGIDFKPSPDGPQYEFSQRRGVKRNALAETRTDKIACGEESRSRSGSGSDAPVRCTTPSGVTAKENGKEAKSDDNIKGDPNPYFVVDVNPTPVNLPIIINPSTKRDSQTRSPLEPIEKKSKKIKTKHDKAHAKETTEKKIEFEDISEEVDARLKKKEEKRRQKGEKKRKRASDAAAGADAKVVENSVILDRPKKKKKRSEMVEREAVVAGAGAGAGAGTESTKRRGSGSDEVAEEGKKKKRLKKSSDGDLGSRIE